MMSFNTGAEYEFYTPSRGKINLGRSKHRSEEHRINTGEQFLYHANSGSSSSLTPTAAVLDSSKGLHTTKFHRGFNRRNASNISNIFSQQEGAYAVIRAQKMEALAVGRVDRLSDLERTHGYNVVTGAAYGNRAISVEKNRKTCLGDGLGKDSAKEAEIILRESTARYYLPPPDGPAQVRRESLLLRQGLLKDKRTSSLTGKNDLRSFGVEDQFSKSLYTQASDLAKTGLVETCAPGAYLRRQESIPVGNWGKGVVL